MGSPSPSSLKLPTAKKSQSFFYGCYETNTEQSTRQEKALSIP